jgi:hypothetical protein
MAPHSSLACSAAWSCGFLTFARPVGLGVKAKLPGRLERAEGHFSSNDESTANVMLKVNRVAPGARYCYKNRTRITRLKEPE